MIVVVTIDLTRRVLKKHQKQMQEAARDLTNDRTSVEIHTFEKEPVRVMARFSFPDARQIDVVDQIGRAFWDVDDYNDSSISFSKRRRRT